jgi:hypothetical protein
MPDIFMILDDLGRNVAALRESLSALRALVGKDGPFPMAVKPMRTRGRRRKTRRSIPTKPGRKAKFTIPPPRRRYRISAKVRALRKKQGRYMGLVRDLSAAQKAQVKKVRAEKGLEAAVKLAASMRPR